MTQRRQERGAWKKNKRKVELEGVVKGHKKGETVFEMEKEQNRIVRSRGVAQVKYERHV